MDPRPGSETHADVLLRYLERLHASVLARVHGVSEHDARRPLTTTGTSLLGVVKHLAHCQLEYVLECCGRSRPADLPHLGDAAMEADEDLWLRPDESRREVLALYAAALEQTRLAVDELGVDAPVDVPWWGARRATTLGVLLVHLVAEGAQHAGHLDILREQLDGDSPAREHTGERASADYWSHRVHVVQAAADEAARRAT